MNQDIIYSGYSAVPSDYESTDGELAAAFNIIPEDTGLKAILQPRQLITLSPEQRPVFIHHTSSGDHYIIFDHNDSKLLWRKVETTPPSANQLTQIGTTAYFGFTRCDAVGNTLLIFTESEIIYILWADNTYKVLGNKLPDIDISFGLVGHPRLFSQSDTGKAKFTVEFAEEIKETDIRNEFSDENKTAITARIMAKLNKFIREQTVDKGRFCFPFFVRYALRLFDGSLACHSAPILMNPSTRPAPLVTWGRVKGKGTYQKAEECDILLMASTLDYRVLNPGELEKWEDIVKSIDVFISQPIYTYDQNGKITNLTDTDNFDTTFIGRLYHGNTQTDGLPQFAQTLTEDNILQPIDTTNGDTEFLNVYAEWPYYRIYQLYFSADRKYPGETFHLPEFSDDKNNENLRNCCTFYKLHTITPQDAKSGSRQLIPVEDDYLQSLVTREAMTDDYLTHDRIIASCSQNYNSRINLSGIKRKPFAGFPASTMLAFCNADIGFNVSSTSSNIVINTLPAQDELKITVFIKDNGKTIARQVTASIPLADWGSDLSGPFPLKRSWGAYLFYPNVNAFKIAIQSRQGRPQGTSLPSATIVYDLQPHDFLNGAYCLLDYNSTRIQNTESNPLPQADYGPHAYIDCDNKVYTSEVNNPFFFPLSGINTVGTGKILGIATAAKALSQGQFGQFPLYAFTSEGVWAMEVNSAGSYSARQPITRDVCKKPDSITQIDSAVLFATDRGIMLISGSETRCITDTLNSDTPFDLRTLPGFESLHNIIHPAENDTCIPFAPFSSFISECGILYDYVHQHIILYSPQHSYAYVYSMKSQKWGMIHSDIQHGLNSYPDACAVTRTGALVNFSQPKTDPDGRPEILPALLVTRPLKLQSAGILKTVDNVIQRGHFRKGHVRSVLYGSRDLFNWHLIWSSKDHFLRGFSGTPYKYFRIALLCNLQPDESILAASMQFTPRQTNNPK